MMVKSATHSRRVLKSAVVAGVTLGTAALGLTTFAQAGDIYRPGGNGGFSHGGNFGSHNGGFGGGQRSGGGQFGGGQRMGGGQFGGGQRLGAQFGGTQRPAGFQRFDRGQRFDGGQRLAGSQRIGRVAPVYGNGGVVSGYRPGHYAWTGNRHQGWRYGAYGLGTGLALGGLAYGASAYPYYDGYGYGQDYAAPGYADEGGDPNYADTEYGYGVDPAQDEGGAWDANGTHYTCSPYEKKTRLQKRACGTS